MSGQPNNGEQHYMPQALQGFHLDKKVSITHIISTVLILIGLFQWGGKVETRLSLLEQQQANIQQQFSDDLDEIKDTLKDLRSELRRIRESQQGASQ